MAKDAGLEVKEVFSSGEISSLGGIQINEIIDALDCQNYDPISSVIELYKLETFYVCLCFTSLHQRGHLETAPPIYCPLQRTCSSVNTPFPPGNEPRVVAWQSITLLLRHASSTSKPLMCEF